MSGLNKCMIIGRIGQDIELRYGQGGNAVANFSVATSETWTDKASGEKQERTEWHKVVVFGKTAENCSKYLGKGSQVYVEGKLLTSSYEKDGQTHYSTKIVADIVQFLDSKSAGTPQGQQQGKPQGGYSPQPKPPQQGGYQPPQQQSRYPQGAPVLPEDQDIPF